MSLLACGGLLPAGELALIWEHPVSMDTYGERGLGALVVADDASWSTPDEDPSPQAIWWGPQGQRMVGAEDGLYQDGQRIRSVDGALMWAGQGERVICVREPWFYDELGNTWPYEGEVVDVAVDEQRWLALICDDRCEVLDPEGVLGEAGPRGRVSLHEGRACWSDPQEGPGGVLRCEDGLELEGLPGDALGTALDGGWAAGRLNEYQVPNRLRLVPLDGGTVLSLDRYTPAMPPALAVEGQQLVLGLPWDEQGRVLVSSLP